MSNTAETGIIYRHECSNPDAYYCAKCDGEKERELQSELTKLRKRVEVLEKALEKYALPQTRLTKKHEEEQWRLEPGFHDPQTAVEALKESAKIAAADE